jgi:hypothetical protein
LALANAAQGEFSDVDGRAEIGVTIDPTPTSC